MRKSKSSLIRNGVGIALSLTLSLLVIAQQPGSQPAYTYSPELTAQLSQLQEAALSSDYAYKQVAHLCNNIGPRLSGSPQAEHSVKYVAEELKRLGLEVRLEPVMVPHWVRGEETGALVEYTGQAPGTGQKIVLTALGGSVATPAEGLTAEVIVADSFEHLNSMGRDAVAGKIVLFNVRFDREMAAQGFALNAYGQAVAYRGGGASAAASLGAAASLVRSVGGAEYRLPHTGSLIYAPNVPKIPAAAVAAEQLCQKSRVSSAILRKILLLTPRPPISYYCI